MRCIDELSASELAGTRVFLRTSLNLPIAKDGSVEDVFRLKRALPTIRFLVERGARVIVAGYLGRSGTSMQPVAEALMRHAPEIPMHFFGTPFESVAQEVARLRNGECLILESTRRDPREETNDPQFVQLLAQLADIYVGDAFAEAHRDYASNVAVARLLPRYAGLLMRDEVATLTAARTPASPSCAILGGAKFETKAPLIRELLARYDHLFITGALANDVFKARGLEVGRSLVSEELPAPDVLSHPHLIAPVDVTVEREDMQAVTKRPEEVQTGEKIVDIGPETVQLLAPILQNAQFVLWNGPTGLYEGGYLSWTHAIAEVVAESAAEKVIGGGDTIAALEASGVAMERLGFLSTGGGAMLEYLLKGTLPGIAVLDE